jgi:hypothetical protein
MMEALAVAVMDLRTNLKDSRRAREPEVKPGPSKIAWVTPRKLDCNHGYESSGSNKEGASYWYALVCRKGGVSGVYKDWGNVAPLFLGASGWSHLEQTQDQEGSRGYGMQVRGLQ